MKKKYPVMLSKTEREECQRLIAAGTAPARKLTRARILLKADQGSEGPGWADEKETGLDLRSSSGSLLTSPSSVSFAEAVR